MAGLLTYSGFGGLPIPKRLKRRSADSGTEVAKPVMELTAAGLFRIFTGFPFHHFTHQKAL
jgi:hypothetical protein